MNAAIRINYKIMKIEDLRVGNWVMGYHDPFQWSFEHFDLLKQADLDEIIKEPIPLTEEILLKCGFKNSKSNIITYIYINNPAYYITEIGNCFTFISCDKIRVRSIKYLHELQNIYFATTGEEA